MELDTGIGDALGTGYFLLREEFSAEQHSYLQRARTASANRGSLARSACSICSSWRRSCSESGTVPSGESQAGRSGRRSPSQLSLCVPDEPAAWRASGRRPARAVMLRLLLSGPRRDVRRPGGEQG